MRPGNRKGREDVREGSKDDEEQQKKGNSHGSLKTIEPTAVKEKKNGHKSVLAVGGETTTTTKRQKGGESKPNGE